MDEPNNAEDVEQLDGGGFHLPVCSSEEGLPLPFCSPGKGIGRGKGSRSQENEKGGGRGTVWEWELISDCINYDVHGEKIGVIDAGVASPCMTREPAGTRGVFSRGGVKTHNARTYRRLRSNDGKFFGWRTKARSAGRLSPLEVQILLEFYFILEKILILLD